MVLESLKEDYMWVLNFHTQVLMKMEGELTDHELEFHSIDEKV